VGGGIDVPLESVLEYLRNWIWHENVPVKRHRSHPHRLSTALQILNISHHSNMASRYALAKRLITDELVMMRVANNGGLSTAIGSAIENLGSQTLGVSW
jgi:hypothetical protein